jgi:hypothetical protein
MNVFLTTAYLPGAAFESLSNCVARDRFQIHQLAREPNSADIILFVENAQSKSDPYYNVLLSHPLVRGNPERVFMYNETDFPWCVLPGIYCSMPRRGFTYLRQRAYCYLYSVNENVRPSSNEEADILYSFVGAQTHKCRRKILKLHDERAVLEDTSKFSIWTETSKEEMRRRKESYSRIMQRSKFILCPRGNGTSSYRLFETMQAGRAPVVISDQWVAPDGPEWERFLLRIPEARIYEIGKVVRQHEHEYLERGQLALQAWDEWFSPAVRFHRVVEACAAILRDRRIPERFARLVPAPELRVFRAKRGLYLAKKWLGNALGCDRS